MEKRRRITKQVRYSFMALGVLAVLAGGCDMLSDDDWGGTTPEIERNTIYVAPGGSGIFDLRSMVRTSQNIEIKITSQPRLGTLQSLGGLLKYSLNPGIIAGRDAFEVTFYAANNQVLDKDSVNIIIVEDGLEMPCTLVAIVDYAYTTGSPVVIDVLKNDIVCDVDTSLLVVSVADAGGAEVEVLPDNRIRYTPTPGAAKFFIYRVEKPQGIPALGDPALISFGLVNIVDSTACVNNLQLNDDLFSFRFDSQQQADSMILDVLKNDIIHDCEQQGFIFSIVEYPNGELYIEPQSVLRYVIPHGAGPGFTDSLVYRGCVGTLCQEAKVIIKLE